MATDLKLVASATAENPDVGDLEVDGTEFVLVRGVAAAAQEAEVALRWERGEWFLDASRGVPWFGQILGKGTPLSTVRELLIAELLRSPEVSHVRRLDLELDRATRQLSGNAEAVVLGEVATITVGPIGV